MSDPYWRVLLVFVGGGVGSVLRYGVQEAAARWSGAAFPAGTLAVNWLGSFLMGLVFSWSLLMPLPPHLRVALTAGVLGGFTTYSAFNQELVSFFQRGAWPLGLLYLVATVMGGILAGLGGYLVARWLPA